MTPHGERPEVLVIRANREGSCGNLLWEMDPPVETTTGRVGEGGRLVLEESQVPFNSKSLIVGAALNGDIKVSTKIKYIVCCPCFVNYIHLACLALSLTDSEQSGAGLSSLPYPSRSPDREVTGGEGMSRRRGREQEERAEQQVPKESM